MQPYKWMSSYVYGELGQTKSLSFMQLRAFDFSFRIFCYGIYNAVLHSITDSTKPFSFSNSDIVTIRNVGLECLEGQSLQIVQMDFSKVHGCINCNYWLVRIIGSFERPTAFYMCILSLITLKSCLLNPFRNAVIQGKSIVVSIDYRNNWLLLVKIVLSFAPNGSSAIKVSHL